MKKDKLINLIIKNNIISKKKAGSLILSGKVLVNETPFYKSGAMIDIGANIRIKEKDKYVSRGAYKLLTAIKEFNINFKDKVCIDVGSSTGGFTQVLIENGAKKIYSVDCGKNLLHYSLRTNSKIVVMENCKVKELNLNDFEEQIDFAVMDVSFSSSIWIIKHLYEQLSIKRIIALIKPQFEFERLSNKIALSNDFSGIVEKTKDREKIINEVEKEIKKIGLKTSQIIKSSIKGTKGNIEYLFDIKESS